jgi:site-specific recombinase XerD
MSKELKQEYNRRIQEKLKELTWFVSEYIDKKRRKLTPATLLNYCHDFIIFLDWVLIEKIYVGNREDIPLIILESLTMQQVEDFLTYLEIDLSNSKTTVNRKLSSLKSLFDYLQNKAETKDLKPYIYRNVMAKIELNIIKEEQETIANRIGGKILRGDDFEQFRQFIASDFGMLNKSNLKITNFHKLNRERDTCIVSLILGSGLRLSELVGSDVNDINLQKGNIRIMRKGNKEQYVYFSETAMLDLVEYLAIRESRYNIDKNTKALFIAATMGPKGKTRRLSARSIEKTVEKYAVAFGKPTLSVHTLRHSFATRYHLENNDVPKLRNQLGHSSIQTTMIYTHLTNDEMRKAVNKMDVNI